MIDEISLADIPCFEGGAESLTELPKIGIFYGPNGSGKSSVARRIVSTATDTCEVLHFSEEYISRILEITDLPGVFTIRDGTEEVQLRLQELSNSEGGLIPEAEKLLSDLQKELEDSQKAVDSEKEKLRDNLWQKQRLLLSAESPYYELFSFAFTPRPGAKKKFLEDCQRLRDSAPGSRSLDDIRADFQSLGEQEHQLFTEMPGLPDLSLLTQTEVGLLSSKLTSSSDSELKGVFDSLGNTEWVLQGLDFLDEEDRCCPFCRERVSASKLRDLKNLVDKAYTEALQTLNSILGKCRSNLTAVKNYRSDIAAHPFADEKLSALLVGLSKSWETNVETLEMKLLSPERPLEVANISKLQEEVEAEIEEINSTIRSRIQLAVNRQESEERLRKDLWNYFVTVEVEGHFATYVAAMTYPLSEIARVNSEFVVAKEHLEALTEEYSQLYSQLSDSKETVEQINNMLRSIGFFSFSVLPQEDEDTYRLVREDGSDAAPTLSEGEKTFIAFLYFYASTMQKAGIVDDDTPLVAVIDDPVSSLDSDTLFLIAILTKNLIARCDYRKNRQVAKPGFEPSRLQQIFLLTHNAYFHKEVTNRLDAGKKWDLAFYVLRKKMQEATAISRTVDNPIHSQYSRLWAEVREGISKGYEVSTTVQNSMRRIIETYFHSQGGVKIDHLRNELSPAEYSVCLSLVSWLHDGSHNIPWDPDFSPTQFDNVTYYEVFETLFKYNNQEQHYNFMISAD